MARSFDFDFCGFSWVRLRLAARTWLFLAAAYAWIIILLIMKATTYESPVLDSRWTLTSTARQEAGLRAASACGVQAAGLFCAALYCHAKQRQAVLSAALYCLLGVLTFSLDAFDLLWHPYGLELSVFGLASGSGGILYSTLLVATALKRGEQAALKTSARPAFWIPPVWFCFWPLPHTILKLWHHTSSAPLATVLTILTVGTFGIAGASAALKARASLQLRLTVVATGCVFWLAWAISDVLHLLVAYGHESVSTSSAHNALHAMVVSEMVQIGVSVTRAIIAHEESSRLRAQRDAAQAESASRKEQLLQAKQGDEARQKFLRYIFHEIRVPFNSIDMGLNMLIDDIYSCESDSRSRPLSLVSSHRRLRSKRFAPPMLHHHVSSTPPSMLQLPLEAKDTIETLIKAAASMKVIINDTLDWTKLQSGAFKIRLGPCSMHAVVQDSLQGLDAFARHNRIKLIHHIDRLVEQYLLADSVRLQQVVANFVSNAIKFAPSDGSGVVTIQIRALDDSTAAFDTTGVWWKAVPVPRQGAGAPSPLPAGGLGTDDGTLQSMNSLAGSSVVDFDTAAKGDSQVLNKSSSRPAAKYEPVLARHSAKVLPATHSSGVMLPPSISGPRNSLPSLLAPVIGPAVSARLFQQGFRPIPAEASNAPPRARRQSGSMIQDGSRADMDVSSWFFMQQLGIPGSTPLADDATKSGRLDSVWASSSSAPRPKMQTIIISVKDNGEGVSAEEAPVLFSAFRQLDAGMQYKGKGTGLGLAICYEIVTLHGGRVGVRSSGKKGEGAEFLVALRLPVLEECSAEGEGDDTLIASSAVFAPASQPDRESDRSVNASLASPADNGNVIRVPDFDGQSMIVAQRVRVPHLTLPLQALGVGPQSLTIPVAPDYVLTSSHRYGADPSSYRPSSHVQSAAQKGDSLTDPVESAALEGAVEGAVFVSLGKTDFSSQHSQHPSLGLHAAPITQQSSRVLRLLIVDDVGDNRKLLKRALTRNLCSEMQASNVLLTVEADEAEDGHIAVEMVSQRGAHYYDVITMDAEMPTMSGFIATEKIRQLGYTGLLYGCTGNALEEDQELFRKQGANEVFIKPLNVAALSAKITQHLYKG